MASKYRAAKAGHISAKGNGGKLLGRKDTTTQGVDMLNTMSHVEITTIDTERKKNDGNKACVCVRYLRLFMDVVVASNKLF